MTAILSCNLFTSRAYASRTGKTARGRARNLGIRRGKPWDGRPGLAVYARPRFRRVRHLVNYFIEMPVDFARGAHTIRLH